MLRGNSHGNIGNYDQAIADYSKAIELNPNEGNAYYKRAHAHYSKGQLSRAVADFESCLPFAPDMSVKTDVKNYIDYLNNHGAKDGDVDFSPRMPEVDSDRLTEEVLIMAQDMAEIQSKRHLVILTPGRLIKTSDTLPSRETLAPDFISMLESIAPSNKRLNIIAVGMTEFRAFNAGPNNSVPFLYLLHGFVQIGHPVILFEGHPSGFTQMCRNRDLLVVDSEMIPFLQTDWIEIAKSTMRNPSILKVNRKGMNVHGTQML
jgi:hypothetical protein